MNLHKPIAAAGAMTLMFAAVPAALAEGGFKPNAPEITYILEAVAVVPAIDVVNNRAVKAMRLQLTTEGGFSIASRSAVKKAQPITVSE